MNSCYLGNSIDLIKLDLLTHLIQNSEELGLFYIPMLTEPKPKERNPKHETYEVGALNLPLLKLLKREYANEFSNIEVFKKYFIQSGIHLSIFLPINGNNPKYFDEKNRKDYFRHIISHHNNLANQTLIYIDPDVGCDIGISRRFRSNKSMYIKRQELISVYHQLRKGEILSYFQHLGDANYNLEDRLKDLQALFGNLLFLVAYTRIQAGFVFIFNDRPTYKKNRDLLEVYFKKYAHLKHRDKLILLS